MPERRLQKVKVSATAEPLPPDNFAEVDKEFLSTAPPPGSEDRITTFSFKALPPSKLKLEKKVSPTWIEIAGKKMDEKEEKGEGELGG